MVIILFPYVFYILFLCTDYLEKLCKYFAWESMPCTSAFITLLLTIVHVPDVAATTTAD